MSHPSHGSEWKSFNDKHKEFAADPRNIRLGLASDGFNPFGHQSATYSMWPVLVIPYNMPPNVCTKESNYMMALLIPGPKSPGKDFDLFMEPLVEELQQLWRGVLTRDLYSSPPADFFLRAVIIGASMIIRLWALCQGERHMVTMHVFAVTGIRCHTQYLARSVTLDTAVSLPRTSRILENTEDMCSMQSMKTVMRQRGSPPMSCKWN